MKQAYGKSCQRKRGMKGIDISSRFFERLYLKYPWKERRMGPIEKTKNSTL